MESENGADQNPRGYDEDAEDCPQFKFTDRFHKLTHRRHPPSPSGNIYIYFSTRKASYD